MKQISCGFLVFDKDNYMLCCHPTGRKMTDRYNYDIPKGHVEEGEDYLETAKRELREETGLIIPDGTKILDMGRFKYRADKDLVVFVVKMDFNFGSLNCTSTFEYNGKNIKEMDRYFMTKDTDEYFKNLKEIIDEILSNNKVKEYLNNN